MRRAPAVPDMAAVFDRAVTAPARRTPPTVERKTEAAIVDVVLIISGVSEGYVIGQLRVK